MISCHTLGRDLSWAEEGCTIITQEEVEKTEANKTKHTLGYIKPTGGEMVSWISVMTKGLTVGVKDQIAAEESLV